MDTSSLQLVDTVKEAFRDKKAKKITVVDLSDIGEAVCDYFVICEGNTPTQVSAIYDRVEELVRKKLGEKPAKIAGTENCLWVAMDYINVMVHVFVPDMHDYYSLETLWADSKISVEPDEQ